MLCKGGVCFFGWVCPNPNCQNGHPGMCLGVKKNSPVLHTRHEKKIPLAGPASSPSPGGERVRAEVSTGQIWTPKVGPGALGYCEPIGESLLGGRYFEDAK